MYHAPASGQMVPGWEIHSDVSVCGIWKGTALTARNRVKHLRESKSGVGGDEVEGVVPERDQRENVQAFQSARLGWGGG